MPPSVHPATQDVDALSAECDIRFTRRSGPGGQHRNKVETAVVLLHRPTQIQAEANERRSQAENRRVALSRLRLKLALEVRTSIAPAAPPSALWRSRLQGQKLAINVHHEDFPALLAEALDVIAAQAFDVKQAAAQLGCSTSQLLRLLKLEPLAAQAVNRSRRDRGLRPLA